MAINFATSYLNARHYLLRLIATKKLVIKTIWKPNSVEVDEERLARELDMIHLASEDCAIPFVGRHSKNGAIDGFITPLGKCLTQGGDATSSSVACR